MRSSPERPTSTRARRDRLVSRTHRRAGPRARTAAAARRRALALWLVGERVDDVIAVVDRGTADDTGRPDPVISERWTAQELLYALWDDPVPVPDALATLLGLPSGASFAATVRLLDRQRRQMSAATLATVVDTLAGETRDPDAPPRILPQTDVPESGPQLASSRRDGDR